MTEKYFVCPKCRTALRKPRRLISLSEEMESDKYEVLFVDINKTTCPVCQSKLETEEIIKGSYDKKAGPYQTAIGGAVVLAIPLAFGFSAAVSAGWLLSYLLIVPVLATLFFSVIWLRLGHLGIGVPPEFRERAELYDAFDLFYCDECDHPFKEGNRFYPKGGRLTSRRGNIKCASGKHTLVELGILRGIAGGIMIGLVITVYIAIMAAIVEAATDIKLPETLFGVHPLIPTAIFGMTIGIILNFFFRRDRIRRLELIALHERLKS